MNVRSRKIEALIVAAVFLAAAWWGKHYWDASFAAGRQPFFYQDYFEPAVMMACGKGFVVSQPQVPAVKAFLERTTSHFSCAEIPAGTQFGTEGMYQRAWRYLMFATAVCWRVRGISWPVLGALLGVLFGGTIVAAYGILRLGMGRAVALCCTFGFSVSTLHLLNLPHLRDYSKAPFTLALIFLLGAMVRSRPARNALFACAAAYGVVLGVGYGFRTDFLVNIPVFFLVLFGFVDGGMLRNLRVKTGAAALCVAAFLATAWPIVSVVYQSGGCQWHTALLGLATNFTNDLGVENGPYDFSDQYSDSAIYRKVSGYARRLDPPMGPMVFCTHEYDVATGQYLVDVARQFPADMVTRMYASVLKVMGLAWRAEWASAPLPELATRLYSVRHTILDQLARFATWWIVAAVVIAGFASARLAFFLVFFLVYFGGYPVLQFANRHYFHLEIISWWALGFVVYQTLAAVWQLQATRALLQTRWRPAIATLAVIVTLLVLPLPALRAYQQHELQGFLQRYLDAPVDEWPIEPTPQPRTVAMPMRLVSDVVTVEQFIAVSLKTSKCGDGLAVTFRYDKAFPAEDITRTLTLPSGITTPEPTRIFMPVYRRFTGVEFSDARPGCIDAVGAVRDVQGMRLLLPVVLSPGWREQRLAQTLREWPW